MTLKTPVKRKPKLHHKKISGAHQHGNKTFHKTYWPYLPLFVIVLTGFFLHTLLGSVNRNVLGYATDVSIPSLLSETNIERKQNQLNNLSINQELSAAAQAKAEDMVARNYWAHVNPEGKQPWDFIKAAGYDYAAVGENLAYGFTTSDAAINGWMNSPGHRENLLRPNYSEVGFGIASSPDYNGSGPETIVVAMYGQPADPTINLTATVPQTSLNTPAEQVGSIESQNVSRLQLVTGETAPWLFVIAAAFVSIGFLILVSNHAAAWHRRLVKGEQFFLHHPLLDIAILGGITVLILLTQTSGFIQ